MDRFVYTSPISWSRRARKGLNGESILKNEGGRELNFSSRLSISYYSVGIQVSSSASPDRVRGKYLEKNNENTDVGILREMHFFKR